jgi:hypothetical protein
MIIGGSLANLQVGLVSNGQGNVGNSGKVDRRNGPWGAFHRGGGIRPGGGRTRPQWKGTPRWNREDVSGVFAASHPPTGQGTYMSSLVTTSQMFRPSSSIPLALPEAAKALEEAWQRRRRELAGWQPSNGWLIEPASETKRNAASR